MPKYNVGDRVEARHGQVGEDWYPGTITDYSYASYGDFYQVSIDNPPLDSNHTWEKLEKIFDRF